MPKKHRGALYHVCHADNNRHYHAHQEVELLLWGGGTATYIAGTTRFDLHAGQAIWFFPGVHHVQWHHSKKVEIWVCFFRKALIGDLAKENGVRTMRFSQGHWTEILGLCQRFKAYEGDVNLFNASVNYLAHYVWSRGLVDEVGVARHGLHPAVQHAVDLLQRDPTIESLDALARKSGLSKHRLSRLFNAEMGLSMTDYRNNLRIQRFLYLKRTTNRTMLDLALETGFGSYTQFNRAFHRHMGCSPRDYQQPA